MCFEFFYFFFTFGEANLEKATSTNLNLRGVKQNQSVKKVKKLKK